MNESKASSDKVVNKNRVIAIPHLVLDHDAGETTTLGAAVTATAVAAGTFKHSKSEIELPSSFQSPAIKDQTKKQDEAGTGWNICQEHALILPGWCLTLIESACIIASLSILIAQMYLISSEFGIGLKYVLSSLIYCLPIIFLVRRAPLFRTFYILLCTSVGAFFIFTCLWCGIYITVFHETISVTAAGTVSGYMGEHASTCVIEGAKYVNLHGNERYAMLFVRIYDAQGSSHLGVACASDQIYANPFTSTYVPPHRFVSYGDTYRSYKEVEVDVPAAIGEYSSSTSSRREGTMVRYLASQAKLPSWWCIEHTIANELLAARVSSSNQFVDSSDESQTKQSCTFSKIKRNLSSQQPSSLEIEYAVALESIQAHRIPFLLFLILVQFPLTTLSTQFPAFLIVRWAYFRFTPAKQLQLQLRQQQQQQQQFLCDFASDSVTPKRNAGITATVATATVKIKNILEEKQHKNNQENEELDQSSTPMNKQLNASKQNYNNSLTIPPIASSPPARTLVDDIENIMYFPTNHYYDYCNESHSNELNQSGNISSSSRSRERNRNHNKIPNNSSPPFTINKMQVLHSHAAELITQEKFVLQEQLQTSSERIDQLFGTTQPFENKPSKQQNQSYAKKGKPTTNEKGLQQQPQSHQQFPLRLQLNTQAITSTHSLSERYLSPPKLNWSPSNTSKRFTIASSSQKSTPKPKNLMRKRHMGTLPPRSPAESGRPRPQSMENLSISINFFHEQNLIHLEQYDVAPDPFRDSEQNQAKSPSDCRPLSDFLHQ